MERKAFMKSIGKGAAFTLTFSCLHGCLEAETGLLQTELLPDENGVLFTLDLNSADGQTLKNPGDYLILNTVVIAINLAGDFVAATQVCSHEAISKVIYRNDEFYCTEHGARFTQQGIGLNANAAKGLQIYPTLVEEDQLSILAP